MKQHLSRLALEISVFTYLLILCFVAFTPRMHAGSNDTPTLTADTADTSGVYEPVLKATTTPGVTDIIVQLVVSYPVLGTVLVIIGTLRLVLKPLFSIWHAYVLTTPGTGDDALYTKVQDNPITKTVFYLIDWFGSIKPRPTAAVQPAIKP